MPTMTPTPWGVPKTKEQFADALRLAQETLVCEVANSSRLAARAKFLEEQIEELKRDRQWLRQLCQQQSASIERYFASR